MLAKGDAAYSLGSLCVRHTYIVRDHRSGSKRRERHENHDRTDN